MAENVERSSGRPEGYKFNRGGVVAEMGPYTGVVKNNVDPTRSGKVQVFIEQFAGNGGDENDPRLWRLVSYVSPFYGITQKTSTDAGAGSYPGNQQSYGMWFTPPDLGTRVLCWFPGGDSTQGYYFGCILEPGYNHMMPAIGASSNYTVENANQKSYFSSSPQLPVTEINSGNEKITENPQFYRQPKPVHSYQAAILFQQGLEDDTERGPISSSAQRESPSAVYGISTPGRPIYQGGLKPDTIKQQLAQGSVKPQDVNILGREGGHTFVMDDGDLSGNNNLVRLRTSKGHQITMSDSGNFFYITHANGMTWIELGEQGTVDIFSTNSVNIRTQGDLNFHADRDINMYAGRNFHVKAQAELKLESSGQLSVASVDKMVIGSQKEIGLISGGAMAIKGKSGYFGVAGELNFRGSKINLNGCPATSVSPPVPIQKTLLDNTQFSNNSGWKIIPDSLESICSRAPTHEPWPYHNLGVNVPIALEPGVPSTPPAAQPIPPGWDIKVE
jgi:hypothetical protein